MNGKEIKRVADVEVQNTTSSAGNYSQQLYSGGNHDRTYLDLFGRSAILREDLVCGELFRILNPITNSR